MKTRSVYHYRPLRKDEVIREGDEFVPAGIDEWRKVHDSIGRTVREQLARDTNYATKWRRPISR